MSERNGTLKFFDKDGHDMEDSDPDLYQETDSDVPVIYVEYQNDSWKAAKFRIEVEKLRNLHDINVKGAERFFERTKKKARREKLSQESQGINWSEHTTFEDHPEWFKGWNIYFLLLIITNFILSRGPRLV